MEIPVIAEYIWIDGQKPTKKLRSKGKVLFVNNPSDCLKLENLPDWTFDGSSTGQADTGDSDCILKPVRVIPDPVRGEPNVLVLCQVFTPGKVHWSNTRSRLAEAATKYGSHRPWFGVEQEYTLYDRDGGRPYRWPARTTAFPGPQGPYYCGVGCDEVYGEELVEAHLTACLKAGLHVCGINAEVMPSQWEFQVGPLGPLEVADELWLARYLLYRIGQNYGISAKLDPKPVAGDWNGAGAHTNFSTEEMREAGGVDHIVAACEKLRGFHKKHIAVYGAGNEARLTGKHETCDINTFKWGVAHRGCSIRIPLHVKEAGQGYLEDRRPAANMDPYEVCTALIETICGEGFQP